MSNELVWDRPEPPSKPSPTPLSRELIVTAAIRLADGGGLDEVSLRKVAAALNAGPMRLYGYIETKDELLDLMVDEVYGEIALPEPGTEWRSALTQIAHGIRAAAKRHPWLVDLLGGRPHRGPNSLAHIEASLGTLDGKPEFPTIDHVLGAVGAVMAFVHGAVRNEIAEARAEQSSGMTEEQWQAASGPYMQRMLATGKFPTLAKVMYDAEHTNAASYFDTGLSYVLDGIATRHTPGSTPGGSASAPSAPSAAPAGR
ncbi:TetR/AcrR family transcriptional regulator C-terminal domain-containing protein [Lentzea sp. BCCO 10_0856]|uniref:TetR/AcrR family transcriptional regulator C-terminal domain-containing protein n=1 Tax=Lentzea miocenica TaxID=3095431 RepID=A0ABU4T6X2_9PSEU|nr:TetR/AcrR family transcriptional regulator C-terminal domain-containing protein [Lentzea sp. BCCO 10_0856]MDX8033920.1 TetR/AcrR family transcriptional regulator C-terminal domain-containing protein [Lentzea sp. BCCO 10_0856]